MSDQTPQTQAAESEFHGLPAGLFTGSRKEKFAALCAFSARFQQLAKITGKTVNSYLTRIYNQRTGAERWETFKNWKEEGLKVKKGEKGFPFFSAPKEFGKKAKDESEKTGPAEDEKDRKNRRFTLAYLFNDTQVETLKKPEK